MKILTWNINSVRLRTPLYAPLVEQHAPDIICLQETKTEDKHFPFDAFKDLGYEHIHIQGMKSYNGLAIISKIPFESTDIHHRCGREDCRHISVKINPSSRPSAAHGGISQPKDGDPSTSLRMTSTIEIHNLYIPAGGDEPDPEINDKFAHKLDFVDEMTDWFQDNYTADQPLIALGDFNIAPLEHDVWSHKQLLKVVSHTPPETERLAKMKASLNWVDSSREFIPEGEKCYTWWSYRNRDWKKSNRGRRLDHIWVTEPLKPALSGHKILQEARDWEKPSDHVPLMIDLDV